MIAGVGIKEKEWKCCPWWRALVAAKASETCIGILAVLAVPFPGSLLVILIHCDF